MPFNTASSTPNSRESLAYYALRALGEGALDIAITEQQMSDRIEDALEFYREFNYDGTQRVYLKHQVTGNILTVADATVFDMAESVKGQTSGATVNLINLTSNTTLTVGLPTGTFIPGETIIGESTGHTTTVTSWTNGDISNGYITIPDSIQGVIGITPFSSTTSTNSVFDIRFQLRMSDLYALQTAQLVQYEQIQYHLALIEDLFVVQHNYRFNRKMNQIYIDMNWGSDIQVGNYLLFECYDAMNPDTWPEIYNDISLKKLAKAYMKKQWGVNLKMYSGVQLPGGIMVNGQQIYDEAVQECEEAEQFMRDTYELPAGMVIG